MNSNHNTNRRTFLKAAAGALALIGWGLRADTSRRVQNVGLQLYTVRREMVRDFSGTLAKIAALGYREMEFAGYFGNSPREVRRILDDLGMTSPATHVPLPLIRNNLEAEIEAALVIGQKYIVVPFIPAAERSVEHYHRHAELLNRAGSACRETGLQMGYHNHSFEFVASGGQIPGGQIPGGQIPYDILLSETDAELVAMEMDLFWIIYAGVDPIPYFNAHPGRFAMLHVKDMDSSRKMVDVGSGGIDFSKLFSYQDTAGFKHYFVEHDNPSDGLTSVAASIGALRKVVF